METSPDVKTFYQLIRILPKIILALLGWGLSMGWIRANSITDDAIKTWIFMYISHRLDNLQLWSNQSERCIAHHMYAMRYNLNGMTHWGIYCAHVQWVGGQWVNSLVMWYHVHSPVAVFHSYPIIFIFLYRPTRIHVHSIHIHVATRHSHIPSNMNTFGEQ